MRLAVCRGCDRLVRYRDVDESRVRLGCGRMVDFWNFWIKLGPPVGSRDIGRYIILRRLGPSRVSGANRCNFEGFLLGGSLGCDRQDMYETVQKLEEL